MEISDLGMSLEELQDRVVGTICDRLLTTGSADDEGVWYPRESDFSQKLDAKIQERLDASVAEIVDKHILPNATKYIEEICLQETNKWGEKKGEPVQFLEYLTRRAEAYLTEEVNYEGKAKRENRFGGSWSASQTRVAHMVHKHLHYSIEAAMKDALKDVESKVAGGLAQAVKIKLDEVTKAIKVEVKTR